MDRAQYDNGHNLPDDHWIFEELGSPQKLLRKNLLFCDGAASRSENFGEKMRVYASNMRKLITAARAEINSLLQQNTILKQKLESSGVVECPACSLRFKPKKMHRILPKYITVQNKKKEKNDLTNTRSLLPSLLPLKGKTELRRERTVISARPHKEEASADSQGCTSREPHKLIQRAAERERFYRISKEVVRKSSLGTEKGHEGCSQDHRKRPRSCEYRRNIVNAVIPRDSSLKLLCSTGHLSRMKCNLDAPHLTKRRSLSRSSRVVDVTIDMNEASIIEIDNHAINNQEIEDGEILD